MQMSRLLLDQHQRVRSLLKRVRCHHPHIPPARRPVGRGGLPQPSTPVTPELPEILSQECGHQMFPDVLTEPGSRACVRICFGRALRWGLGLFLSFHPIFRNTSDSGARPSREDECSASRTQGSHCGTAWLVHSGGDTPTEESLSIREDYYSLE